MSGQVSTARSKVWSAIRFLKRFTLEDLEVTAEVGYDNCHRFVRQLRMAGYLKILAKDNAPGQRCTYLLVRNTGPLTPSATDLKVSDANVNRVFGCAKSKTKPGRERAWKVMREHKPFTTVEISNRSGCSMTSLHRYVRALLVGGYLEVIAPATPGPYAASAIYRLIRDTGDLAPVVQRDGSLVDPNLTIDGDERDE